MLYSLQKTGVRRTHGPNSITLDKKLLRLSKAGDYITRRMLVQGGVQIFGRGGGGKSSGSWRALKIACHLDGHGMLELCCKPEAAEDAIKLAKLCGREKDLIVVRPGRYVYRFIKDAIKHHGHEKGVVEQVVDRLMEAEGVATRNLGGTASDPFWASAKRQLIRDACFVDMLAHKGSLSLMRLLSYFQSLPTSFESLDRPDRHAILGALALAKKNCPPERRTELALAEGYFTSEVPLLSPECRSSITITTTVGLNPLMRYPLIDLFDGQGEEIDPEKCIEQNKLVVLDISSKVYGETVAKMAGVVFKVGFQEALHRRWKKEVPGGRQYDELGLFGIFADESQNFISQSGLRFVDTCRSTRGYLCYSTQNLPGYEQELGSTPQAKKIVETLLANLNIIIGHGNSDTVTNEWFANRVGKEWANVETQSFRRDPQELELALSGSSVTPQQVFQCPPETFMHLQHGSDTSKPKFVVEGVVTCGGPFKWNGKRAMIVGFPQEIKPEFQARYWWVRYTRIPITVLWEKTPFARNWIRHVRWLSVVRRIWTAAFWPKFRLWANFWSDGRIVPDVAKDEVWRDWEEDYRG